MTTDKSIRNGKSGSPGNPGKPEKPAKSEKIKKQKTRRKAVQFLSSLLFNGNLKGFTSGLIYSGSLKKFCVPGLNCYSCPGALGACPIGSMQAMFSARHPKFAFYVIGYLSLIGVLVGRFICGWLCLFGLIQELLYKIPVKKIQMPERLDRLLRKLKYVILAVFVVLLPIILRDEYGVSFPYFCKWICPVGILEGGIPLLALNEPMRAAAHGLFAWKFGILIAVILLSMIIHRPFCKYLCPLGAFYGIFHRVGFLKLNCDSNACVSCGLCSKTCKMGVNPTVSPNSAECIRCGECIESCPAMALKFTFGSKEIGKELGESPRVSGRDLSENITN